MNWKFTDLIVLPLAWQRSLPNLKVLESFKMVIRIPSLVDSPLNWHAGERTILVNAIPSLASVDVANLPPGSDRVLASELYGTVANSARVNYVLPSQAFTQSKTCAHKLFAYMWMRVCETGAQMRVLKIRAPVHKKALEQRCFACRLFENFALLGNLFLPGTPSSSTHIS
jgi:hypothetical protein